MKILYLHNVPTHSEYANSIQVKSMCKAMASMGHEVVLSVPAASDIDSGTEHRCDEYSIINRKAYKSRYSKYISGYSIADTITKTRPDLNYLRSPLLLKQVFKFSIPYSGRCIIVPSLIFVSISSI